MNRIEAEILAKKLITQHLSGTDFKFRWNNRKRAAGICSYRKKTIELSLPLTLLASLEEVIDTILHEIAHALAGSAAGHGPKWKSIAKSIGCNGERCYTEKSKPSTYEAYKTVAKYKGVCPNGHEVFRNRKPTKHQSCGLCCRKYNPNFLITYSLNS
jgi:SprT protein